MPETHIVITGDITMDWNLARTRRVRSEVSFWSADDTTSTTWQRGGSALLADLVKAVAWDVQAGGEAGPGPFTIHQTGAPSTSAEVHPDNDQYHHSYAMWSLKQGKKPAWRVEEFLGLKRSASDSVQEWQKVVDDTAQAGLVILDDADLGFRNHPELWPAALHESQVGPRPWILLKMARPLAQGLLWDHLHKNFSERLIVVATVDDLRLSEVQISRELSWECTAQDVFWELVHNPCVNSLSHCAHVVISFGPAGAILLSRQNEAGKPPFGCFLFFDPKVIEHMWEKDYPGGMIGYTTCLTAGLVRQWMLDPSSAQPNFQPGIQAGLAALRTLHLEGYGAGGVPAAQDKLVFPTGKIAQALAQSSNLFAVVPVEDPVRFIQGQQAAPHGKSSAQGFWTILQDKFKGELDKKAAQVVLEGPEVALQGVPWGQFGDLLTVDRQEIESYRSIRNLVAEYSVQKQVKRPLSIAVFGAPGSGKSFGVTELAKALLGDQIQPITFNLSQFDSDEELLSALHQVRDIGLSGKIPLVFWDEFDTALAQTPLGWLRYFLAPMQDGKFQEGQISHPIGKAIFVFAGGTSASMEEFNKDGDKDFKAAKGPDFVSRLKGYINVLGPNPVKGRGGDPYSIIRRAILLRSCLKRSAGDLFEKHDGKDLLNIDQGVLRALLKIGEYKHGARSIESLLAMSLLTGKTAFERSCLPPESQLDLHVDGKRFLALVQQIELSGTMLECLAESAHAVFCEGMRGRGYQFGETNDDVLKTCDTLMEYADLPEAMKEANRLNVRDIPIKLASVGYIMIPARSNEPAFEFPGDHLEVLAEAEHARWMQSKLDDDWKYAPKTDKPKKLHECLVPWEQLPEAEKEKDRDLVRGIPLILGRAGYAILKSSK